MENNSLLKSTTTNAGITTQYAQPEITAPDYSNEKNYAQPTKSQLHNSCGAFFGCTGTAQEGIAARKKAAIYGGIPIFISGCGMMGGSIFISSVGIKACFLYTGFPVMLGGLGVMSPSLCCDYVAANL